MKLLSTVMVRRFPGLHGGALLIAALVCVLSLFACSSSDNDDNNDNGGQTDDSGWVIIDPAHVDPTNSQQVAALAALMGTWKGSAVISIPAEFEDDFGITIPASSVNADITMTFTQTTVTTTSRVDMTDYLNTSAASIADSVYDMYSALSQTQLDALMPGFTAGLSKSDFTQAIVVEMARDEEIVLTNGRYIKTDVETDSLSETSSEIGTLKLNPNGYNQLEITDRESGDKIIMTKQA